ncbi:hypothetical protein M427DRAFT_135082 [Gonapodya prolifera JEL478]|uniref:Uncharacterized protein n=1 Tax=Gonapodya prolifera (strain JEL478) TaxID=1344416 RepID=A0A139AFQ6_GONPJ|nr:hypothetical protein M427DRAFT_135082 [Gonapodya prolifera JEL478]|eukprot:KXS15636.1 hypothetical protein M427DRAFT_135082 [Gonapodya prolifera JEL478]
MATAPADSGCVSPVWSSPSASASSSLETSSARTYFVSPPAETSPTLRWASKNADALRVELERLHFGGGGGGSTAGSKAAEQHLATAARVHAAQRNRQQQRHTHEHAIPVHRVLSSSSSSSAVHLQASAASDDAESQFELPFIEDDNDDGRHAQRLVQKAASFSRVHLHPVPVRTHTHPLPVAAVTHSPHAPQPPPAAPAAPSRGPHKSQSLTYTDLTSFQPYDRTLVSSEADRLSLLSYPGSTVFPPHRPSLSFSRPSNAYSSTSTLDTLYVPEDAGDAEYVLEWKNGSDSAYKEIMGMLGREEWSVQRGWAYKKTNVDSLQWSISYVPGKFDNVIADTSGALPRLELTLFYNSLPLFLTATQTLPARLPNLRIPTFVSHIVSTLPFATEWAQIISPGPARLWCNTYRLALIVRAQGEDLSPRCRGILQAWAAEVWRTERLVRSSAVVGALSKAAKEGITHVGIMHRLREDVCPRKRAEKAQREMAKGL